MPKHIQRLMAANPLICATHTVNTSSFIILISLLNVMAR